EVPSGAVPGHSGSFMVPVVPESLVLAIPLVAAPLPPALVALEVVSALPVAPPAAVVPPALLLVSLELAVLVEVEVELVALVVSGSSKKSWLDCPQAPSATQLETTMSAVRAVIGPIVWDPIILVGLGQCGAKGMGKRLGGAVEPFAHGSRSRRVGQARCSRLIAKIPSECKPRAGARCVSSDEGYPSGPIKLSQPKATRTVIFGSMFTS